MIGQREVPVGHSFASERFGKETTSKEVPITTPATDEAQQWSGWGTALKPAHEPIVMARKPIDGTVANNVLKHGVGGINIDGCRVGSREGEPQTRTPSNSGAGHGGVAYGTRNGYHATYTEGRFPANFIHDGSEEVLALFPDSKGGAFPKKSNVAAGQHYEGGWGAVENEERIEMGDGSAARFFYCAKASKAERNAGLEELPLVKGGAMQGAETRPDKPTNHPMRQNFHPTVKPIALMRYLVRLVTPPNGTVLDPFAGSGTTLVAAILEGFNPVGMELTADYLPIINARVEWALKQPKEPEQPTLF